MPSDLGGSDERPSDLVESGTDETGSEARGWFQRNAEVMVARMLHRRNPGGWQFFLYRQPAKVV